MSVYFMTMSEGIPWEAIEAPDEHTAYFSVAGPGHELEDRLRVELTESGLTACIADGHWGAGAAETIVAFWAEEPSPDNRDAAVAQTTRLESMLFERYGKDAMDPDNDLTPEAAFLAIAVHDQTLYLAGYGDCRLLVVNERQVGLEAPTEPTCLGAFSHLGLRGRQPINEALLFRCLPLIAGDSIALFTDGLDEWGHDGRPSLSPTEIAAQFGTNAPAADIVQRFGNVAFSHNAQDDVSLLVHNPQ